MKTISILLTAAAAISLSACGGGGGGSTTATTTAATTAAISSVAGFATSVPAPTYALASEELSAFTLLNNERNRCGFGLLAQNSQLDAAAIAHADYQIINNLDSHFENQTTYPAGFTGIDGAARALAKGYTNAGVVADEYAIATSGDPAQPKAGIGQKAIRSLLNAPYHMSSLVSGYRDVGISVRSSVDTGTGTPGIFTQIDAAYKTSAGQQLIGSSDVMTYPCDGTAGVNRQLLNEVPNPVPGRDLSVNPLGSTVYIAVRDGNVLTITTASMVKISTGQVVALRAPVTSANDPHAPCTTGCYKSHQGYVVPDAPLDASSAYQVNLTGTNNGVTFSRNFTFTTGA